MSHKPEGVTLKFQACMKEVAYFTNDGITEPRDEWMIFLVDKNGDCFARTAPDDSGRIYRWRRTSSNRKGVDPTAKANEFLHNIMKYRVGLTILEDNRSSLA